MIQLPLGFKMPRGKVGAAFRVLCGTSPGNPITPLDLAKDPARFGTDCVRNLKHAGEHFIRAGYVLKSEPVDGEPFHRYYVEKLR